mmetsp:Transcript_22034/g.51210  ORF Transcript_22034/g.51210 Transcript_22034/m.51210 type:complete len:214 (+) Transcript_22034:200-841(+)
MTTHTARNRPGSCCRPAGSRAPRRRAADRRAPAYCADRPRCHSSRLSASSLPSRHSKSEGAGASRRGHSNRMACRRTRSGGRRKRRRACRQLIHWHDGSSSSSPLLRPSPSESIWHRAVVHLLPADWKSWPKAMRELNFRARVPRFTTTRGCAPPRRCVRRRAGRWTGWQTGSCAREVSHRCALSSPSSTLSSPLHLTSRSRPCALLRLPALS